jgi:DNA-binding response OmpR family regulator
VTEQPDFPRVLVVDDAPDMRTVISRVLRSRGYRVDTAATLDQARAMTPADYDAILVDARLGSELGTTLIAELTAADPRLASRCLLMSGSLQQVPVGVAALAKPFLPDQLLAAVRALGATEPAALAEPADPAGPAAPPPRLSGLLRERERADIADALHDGPVQGLAAAILGLHLIREQLPTTQRELLDAVVSQVSETATTIRALIGRLSPPWPGASPAAIISNQTAWLLAAPPVVEIRPPADRISQATARLAADVAELALFLASGPAAPGGRRPGARIRVLETEPTLAVEADISWPSGDPGDDATVPAEGAWRETLRAEMASALGADIEFSRLPSELRMRVSLRETLGG